MSENWRSLLNGAIPFTFAAIVSLAFVAVMLKVIDFPLGLHPDEVAKVNEILKSHYLYVHPLLMIELLRATNALKHASDPQALVELGRGLAVLAGGLTIFASFLLARELLPPSAALAATLAVAVVPLVTVHARFLKEDIFALPLLILSLVALIRTIRSPTLWRGALLGLALGFAAGAKYITGIALPFAMIVLILITRGQVARPFRVLLVAVVTLTAMLTFVLIESPALFELRRFYSEFFIEVSHATRGHDVRLPLTSTFGLFHLRESPLARPWVPTSASGTTRSRLAVACAFRAAHAASHRRWLLAALVCRARIVTAKAIPGLRPLCLAVGSPPDHSRHGVCL